MPYKLCLYERGNVIEPEMGSVWLNNSISYNSCQYSFVIVSVGFKIDRVTAQHTPTCVENYSDRKLSYNYRSKFYHIFRVANSHAYGVILTHLTSYSRTHAIDKFTHAFEKSHAHSHAI